MSMPATGNQPIGNAVGQVQQVYGGSMGAVGAAALGSDLGSGGWEFTAEELESVIKKWKDLLDDVEKDRHKIRDIRRNLRSPPSDDDPTGAYYKKLIDGATAMEQSNDSMHSYIKDYISRLEDAKSELKESDDAAARSVRDTAK